MADLRNLRSAGWLSQWFILMVVITAFFTLSGCGKPPTFNELIGNEEKKNETAKKAPEVARSPKLEPVPRETLPPKEPDPDEVIARFMKIPSSRITDADLATVANLKTGREKLTEINLRGSKVTPEGFQQIAAFPQLKKLDISGRQLTDGEVLVIAGRVLLEDLNLERTGINDSTLRAVANLTELKFLNLSNTSITDSGFVHLKKMDKLETFSVYGTQINGSGFKVLSKNRSIKNLNVGQTAFGVYGFKFIKGWGALESLGLSRIGITDEMLHFHKFSFGQYNNLKVLGLSHNNISDLSRKRFAGMKSLEKLYLRDNKKVTGALMGMLKSSKKTLQYVDLERTGCNQAAIADMLKYYQKYNENFEVFAFGKRHK